MTVDTDSIYPTPSSAHSAKLVSSDSKSAKLCEPYLVALGIIVLIGSLVATGCLFPSMGYTSFAVGGSGLLVSLGCVFIVNNCMQKVQNTPVKGPDIQVTPATSLNKASDPKRWFIYFDLHRYASYLASQYPQLAIVSFLKNAEHDGGNPPTIDTINEWVFEHYPSWAEDSENKNLPLFLHVTNNHWTLVYIDRQKRTVEYYDSKKNYGNHNEIKTKLIELAKELSEKEPNKLPYTFECKINASLQPDGYQCGPWAMYFLEKRLNEPDIDFNKLDINAAQEMISNYRISLTKKNEEVSSALMHLAEQELEAYQKYYGDGQGRERQMHDRSQISDGERCRQALANQPLIPGQADTLVM